MTPNTWPPVHRTALKRQPPLAACLALIFIFSGCVSLQLSQFQDYAARGDHEWVAAQTIECRRASEGCGQLHLTKGDACFQLAKMDREPGVNFACAADELEKGLALKQSFDAAGVQLQYREKLCESLRRVHGWQSGKAAEETPDRLLQAANALYQLAPESVPAVYYLASARLMEIKPILADINAATRVPICLRLKRTVNRVLEVIETARGDTPPHWDRFAGDYQRLAFDLGAAMQAAECR
ncbi:hypothetical protein [Desulfosarcina sp.]|uniref:hypothetical protein n=1 Tax=Desulfosarcina sp. TaxID=2027861 RepID=UPI003563CE35